MGLSNEQGLLHFLTEHKRKVEQLREARLKLILQVLAGQEILLMIDETGDRKKGDITAACQKTVHRKFRENREWDSRSHSLWFI